MLQRQIMFKQMQEMQRRQQMQELSDGRNQAYANQLSSGGQFPPTVNGTPVNDSSQMFMLGNMQMMQHGGSGGLQGVPNGMVLSQNQHPSLGPMSLSQPQYGVSLYGNPAANVDKNLNQYSHFQGPSDISGNLLAKNNNMSSGMSSPQPLAFGGSFMNQRSNYSSNQNDTQDGGFQSGQVFQEKNFFGQVPVQSFNSGNLSGNFSDRGIAAQRNFSHLESEGRHDDGTWRSDSRGNDSKFGVPQAASTLDPLEQKILFNTDDNSWGSFSRNIKADSGPQESPMQHTSYMDEFPSLQGGSWSALMQSAVAETSSSDTGVQEEWSGMSFQNPETSNDNQPSNFIDSGRPQNNWVDINKLNASSSDSKPVQGFQSSNKSTMFPGFLQPGHQQNQFHPETFHSSNQQSPRSMGQPNDHDAQQKQQTGRSQLIQTPSPAKSNWPGQHNDHSNNNANKPHNYYSGHDTRGSLWPHQGTSHQAAGGFETKYDQANHLSARKYAPESHNVAPVNNVEHMSTFLGNSSGFQRVNAQSENVLQLFSKDTKSNDQTSGAHLNLRVSSPSELPPNESVAKSSNTSLSGGFSFPLGLAGNQTQQPYPFFPSLSMGNPSGASVPSRNINDYIKNQGHPTSLAGQMNAKSSGYGPAASPDNSQSKNIRSSGQEFQLPENMSLTQPSANVGVPENVGFSLGSPAPWPNMKTQQELPFQKPNVITNAIRPADSATSSGAANDNQKLFKHEYNVLESGNHSGQSEYSEKVLQRGSSDREGSTEMNSASWLGTGAQNKQSESDSVAPVTRQMPPRQAEQRHEQAAGLARDIGAFGHGSRNIQTNHGIDYQQSIAGAKNIFSSGQNTGVSDKATLNTDRPEIGSSMPGNNNQWNFSQDNQLGKAPSTAYIQNLQAANLFGQTEIQKSSNGSNETSNVQHQSQISMQMASSWFKRYGNLKDGQMPPLSNPKPMLNAVQPLPGIPQGNLTMQANLANAYQASNVLPSTAVPPIASKPVVSPSILLPDLSQQNMVASVSKKRKVAAFEMVPWSKEIQYEPSRRHHIVGMAGSLWAQASNRIQEVKYKGESAEDSTFPAVRAKRRLIFTTELMQQVFLPPPAAILHADSTSCDGVVHFAARLALGDACSLTSPVPTETDEASPDKLKTSNKPSSPDFSKVAEVLIGRVQKLEDDLLRVEKCMSIVDVKFDAQELEKFSTINRFAKFHVKNPQSTADPASTGPSTMPKMYPQRYVIPHPMPRAVPESADCLSL